MTEPSFNPLCNILIRDFKISDSQKIIELYQNTVHKINIRDYTQKQINAWAPLKPDRDTVSKILKADFTFVAELNNEIIGFSQLDFDGHIGCFYCHHNFQRMKIGSALMNKIENTAKELKIRRLYSEVSITALPFFEKHGFVTLKKQQVKRFGVLIPNSIMEKILRLS